MRGARIFNKKRFYHTPSTKIFSKYDFMRKSFFKYIVIGICIIALLVCGHAASNLPVTTAEKAEDVTVCAGGVKIRKMRFVPTTVHNVDVGGQKKDILSVRNTTDMIEIPKGGMYIYAMSGGSYRICFFKKDANGNYIPATDYSYYKSHNNKDRHAMYFPYKKDIYFQLLQVSSSPLGSVYMSYGAVELANGRLPNLFNIAMYQKYFDGEEHLCFDNGRNLVTYGRFYGSILRLQDVDKIVAAPPYSIVARIYRIDKKNKQIIYEKDIFATTDHIKESAGIAGVSMIDLSKYDYDGYAVIGIVGQITENDQGRYSVPYMGMLGKYKDVQESVGVIWKPNVSVTYDSNIPAAVKNNIEVITQNTFAPNLKASFEDGGYSNWNRKAIVPIPAMGKVNSWWYGGNNFFNVPHMHVTPISYITASKNRHSRVYVAKGERSKPKSPNYEGIYGSVCSATVSVLLGLPCGVETAQYLSKEVSDMDYFEFKSLDQLKVGDIFARSSGKSYGHVIYLAEKIFINGQLFCINSFEGYAPWIGWNTYINHSGYSNYTMKSPAHDNFNFLSFKSSRWFGDDRKTEKSNKNYKIIARPRNNILKTIRDAYGPYDIQDYPVTSIMCDRGTDAVYCLGEYLGLTVTDGTTAIQVHKDGKQYSTIILSSHQGKTYSDGTVYDVSSEFTEPGYYELYVGKDKKESFYIPPTRSLEVHGITGDEKNNLLLFEKDDCDDVTGELKDEVVAIGVYYIDLDRADVTIPLYFYSRKDTHTVYEGDKGLCQFKFPKMNKRYNGMACEPIDVRVLRRTKYGTYWVSTRSGNNWSDGKYHVKQRAGSNYTESSSTFTSAKSSFYYR